MSKTIVAAAATWLILLSASGRVVLAGDGPTVPLVEGLVIVTALSDHDGDYESIKRVTSVTADGIELSYSANTAKRSINVRRAVRRADLEQASAYARLFGQDGPLVRPGTTAIGTSSAVLTALKAKQQVAITTEVVDADQYRMVEGTLQMVGSEPVLIPVIVNDTRVLLPAIHARGTLQGLSSQASEAEAEFYFLDDPANPLALKYYVPGAPRTVLNVVKLAYRIAEPRIERALEEAGRAEVYGIHFDFGSARIREESEPVLDELARVLQTNPAWTLRIEGHTDNIGGDTYNMELSAGRAAAVKAWLMARHHVSAARLVTVGFGQRRPIETNDTLEGRVRNRRVEIVRN